MQQKTTVAGIQLAERSKSRVLLDLLSESKDNKEEKYQTKVTGLVSLDEAVTLFPDGNEYFLSIQSGQQFESLGDCRKESKTVQVPSRKVVQEQIETINLVCSIRIRNYRTLQISPTHFIMN